MKLRESKHRKSQKIFLVEGAREVERALAAGFIPTTIFVLENCVEKHSALLSSLVDKQEGKTVFSLNASAYEKLAVRSTTESIISLFRYKEEIKEEITLPDNPVICLLDGLEKPGNLGAIFRSCDGAGVDLIIITGEGADVYSPNSIRSSVGSVFNLNILSLSNEKALEFLKSRNIKTYGAVLSESSQSMYEKNLSEHQGVAICLGTEANGLSEFWLKNSSHIIIPMRGISDSLNVSVASAILMYEVTKNK